MKNDYEIRGRDTAIFLNTNNGQLECLIDTADFDKVSNLPGTWYAKYFKSTDSHYVRMYTKISKGNWREISIHRYLFDNPNGLVIDHINHNTLDNRRKNLRVLTHSQNLQNRKGATSLSSSGIRGVSWHKREKKWRAKIRVNGIDKHLGSFNDIEDARKAVEIGIKEYMPYAN
jgi:hypothetical protein